VGNFANRTQARPALEHVDRYGRVRLVPLGPEAQRLFTAHAGEGPAQGNLMGASEAARSLTAREWQVFDFLIAGLSSKQIARELNISPRTVEIHRARLIRKMGARNTVSLVRMALAA
jgi:DNA-binding NarL/FixJ family response regulator